MYTFLILFLLITIQPESRCDDKLTINRLGYGVFFEWIGEITDSNGMIFVPATWSLIIPQFKTPTLPLLNCHSTDLLNLNLLCDRVNRLIAKVNGEVYADIFKDTKKLRDAIELIPLSNTSNLFPTPEEEGAPHPNATKRRKRNAEDDNPLNAPNLQIPDWVSEGTHRSSNLEYLIPGRIAGELFTNLFGMPSSSTIKNLESNLKSLAGAIYTNTENIKNLGNQFQYIVQLSDARMNTLEELANITIEKLRAVNNYMQTFQKDFYTGISNLTLSLMKMNAFKTHIISELYPELNRVTTFTRLVGDFVNRWTFGIINLSTTGYISQYLISEQMIIDALEHIEEKTLKNPLLHAFKLITNDPAFYYKLNRIAYTRAEGKIIINLDIPLFIPQKKLTLYKISSFPMPVKAGLVDDTVASPHGFTYIVDLPAFLAVSQDLDSYLELTDAQYLACDGPVKGIKNCGKNVGIPKLRAAVEKTCAYSIFTDSPRYVKAYCQTAFTKDIPEGSARQLSSDSSFLVQGGGDETYWTMNCPVSIKNSQTKIAPCSLCRIILGCGCSMISPTFIIPTHISGCDEHVRGVPEVTKIYQRNIATIREFVTDENLQEVHSYNESLNKAFPALNIPEIVYTIPDHLSNYIEISEKYAADFARGAELIKKNLTIFKEKTDEALTVARNFSDQEVNRVGSPLGALKSLFDGIFGGEVWRVITALFSPVILTTLAFILALFMFIPEVSSDIKGYKDRKEEESSDRALLEAVIKLNKSSSEESHENYNFSPTKLLSVPVEVTVFENARGEEYYVSVST